MEKQNVQMRRGSSKTKRFLILGLLFLFFSLAAPINAKASPKSIVPKFNKKNNNKIDVKRIEKELEEINDTTKLGDVARTLYSIATIYYGSILMVYGKHVPSQLQALTVMKVAGFSKLQTALSDLQKNIRQTRRSVWRNAPSLLMAKKSIQNMHQQADVAREIIVKTRAAKADGVITAKEEREINRLHKKQLKKIRRDVRRIQRGSSALVRLWDTLDLDEVIEVIGDMVFIATAVLATGNTKSIVGILVAKYCYFVNLGSLLLDMNTRLRNPLSKLVMWILPFFPNTFSLEDKEDTDKDLRAVRGFASILINYSISAYLIIARPSWSITLSNAMMIAYIMLKGMQRFGDAISKPLDGQMGGLWILIVTGWAIHFGLRVEGGEFPIPDWLISLGTIESSVGEVMQVAEQLA